MMFSAKPIELPVNSYAMMCRGCLAENGEMKNMREWGLHDDFCLFTNIYLSPNDEMSELLCSSCEESLVSCRRFREQCQRSDLLLRDTSKKVPGDKQALADCQELVDIEIDSEVHDDYLRILVTASDMQNKIYLPCPYLCSQKYLKQKDLKLHLHKFHHKNENFKVLIQYFCPYPKCSYNKNGNKHFDGRKYLNQHLNKVHAPKEIHCDVCCLTFSTVTAFTRHFSSCNVSYVCALCNLQYKTNDRLLVHLKRKHPVLHEEYKQQRRTEKRAEMTSEMSNEAAKKRKKDIEYFCDSPKRSSSTQTSDECKIKNDVRLVSWAKTQNSEDYRNVSTIETQTVFEDVLSLKSQNSEDDSMFFSETILLSDIQTQTFPVEFGLSRKETNSSETQTRQKSPDLSMKETQTCFCLYDSPKLNYKLFDSVNCSPSSISLTSTETQTPDFCNLKSDVFLNLNSAETQTTLEDCDPKEF